MALVTAISDPMRIVVIQVVVVVPDLIRKEEMEVVKLDPMALDGVKHLTEVALNQVAD